jgi:hypothetical protein
MKTITLHYLAQDLVDWRRGLLHKEWYRQAGHTFCDLDLSNASGQCRRGYHFGEWFVTLIFLQLGYQVLPEKYLLESREIALKKATELLGHEGVNVFSRKRRFGSKFRWPPNPDLLVFKSNRFFFVEVKRDTDELSPAQKAFFPKIEKRFRCSVLIVKLLPCSSSAPSKSKRT